MDREELLAKSRWLTLPALAHAVVLTRLMVDDGDNLWPKRYFAYALVSLWLAAFPSKNPMSNPFFRPYIHLPEGFDAALGWVIYITLSLIGYATLL